MKLVNKQKFFMKLIIYERNFFFLIQTMILVQHDRDHS
jgi:hypothetical protein